jgi:excinuclease UvrABC helicase subunit UvrB
LTERIACLEKHGKLSKPSAHQDGTEYDLEMMEEMGFCSGIENYFAPHRWPCRARVLARLLDFFPEDYLLVVGVPRDFRRSAACTLAICRAKRPGRTTAFRCPAR